MPLNKESLVGVIGNRIRARSAVRLSLNTPFSLRTMIEELTRVI